MSENERSQIVTPTGRIAFCKNLFTPGGDKDRYSAALIFSEEQDLSDLKKLMYRTAREEGIPEKEIKSKKFKWGVKPADEDSIDKYDFMEEGTRILNASSGFEVEVKGTKKGPDGKMEDLIESDIKAGDFCRFLVSAYCWEFSGKKGVSLNLLGVQKVKDGEAFYARVPSDVYFEEEEFDIDVDEAFDDEEFDEEEASF